MMGLVFLHQFNRDGGGIARGGGVRRGFKQRGLASDRVLHFIIFADDTKQRRRKLEKIVGRTVDGVVGVFALFL